MKKTVPPPASVPRHNSLLQRLQENPGPDDQPYLDQLMMFLDHPPSGTTDRWKDGAAMCAAWGIPTTHTSVWRLFISYAVEWRARLALRAEAVELEPEALALKSAEILSLRTCELLANPDTDPATILHLARLALRQKACALAQQKHDEGQRGDADWALSLLDRRAVSNWDAQHALFRLREALRRDGPIKPTPFPFPPAMLEYIREREASRTRLPPFSLQTPPPGAPKDSGAKASPPKPGTPPDSGAKAGEAKKP